MKNCTHCVHANWKRTAQGRLHPSGDGRCTKEVKHPPLPASKYFISPPTAFGGAINRRQELNTHCTYYTMATS